MRKMILGALTGALVVSHLSGCARQQPPAAAAPAESADAFVARVNKELEALGFEVAAAGFTQDTFITVDTQLLNARANDRYLAYLTKALQESRRYDGQQLSPATARALLKLRLNVAAPAPSDPAKRARMTQLQSQLQAKYGESKYCPKGPQSCRNLDQLADVLAKSRNYDELTEAWKGWHDLGKGMRADYTEFVALANEGARDSGFKDLGVMWRANYDMPPEAFDAQSERLWQQVKPLYAALQCYTRARLAKHYGEDKVPAGKPIPAQLLGNMWAQTWGKIYDDLLKPYPNASIETADAMLKAQKWDAVHMTRSAEAFYTSMGFPALPKIFWERSMLTRPRDREVVCHASAWDMHPGTDVRVKTCLEPNEEDLYTIYHELGHVYYYLSYAQQPFLFRDGANDGFHEAIGDTVNLSVTPAYLAKIGLVHAVKPSHEALINQQMKMALDKIAFLPFGRLIDQWRWKVFSGQITPANYNSSWWELRTPLPGHRRAGAAHRGGLRCGREVPHSRQHALHALLPVLHPAVPVPQGAVRGLRQQGPAVRVLELRQQGSRAALPGDAGAGSLAALAGHAREAHRLAADRCGRDQRVLPAAHAVAAAGKPGTAVRLVGPRRA